ncbi:hypothetical protein [Streptomyces sp. NPDC059928]|uniref:hypothetical protein n=1 Tax=unclassified Streptomyces TaxID=2593676 RepID=UPI003668AD84
MSHEHSAADARLVARASGSTVPRLGYGQRDSRHANVAIGDILRLLERDDATLCKRYADEGSVPLYASLGCKSEPVLMRMIRFPAPDEGSVS